MPAEVCDMAWSPAGADIRVAAEGINGVRLTENRVDPELFDFIVERPHHTV